MENWKDIKGYEDYYEVSDLGRVRNKKRGNILSPSTNSRGYKQLELGYNGFTRVQLHRLVMRTFVGDKPFEGAEIDHVDGNKLNNRLDNLEYVTHAENLRRWALRASEPFVAVSPEGVEKDYIVQADLCRDYPELDFRHVSACLQGKLPQHKGWKFYYKDESKRKTFQKTYRTRPFIGTDPNGVEYVGYSQTEFAEEHGLKFYGVSNCLVGKTKTHKGWSFKFKEEAND